MRRVTLWLVVAWLVGGCGGEPAAPATIPPAALTGTYDVQSPSSCPHLTLDLADGAASGCPSWLGEGTVAIDGDTVRVDLVGDSYRFAAFTGDPDEAAAAYLGPCTIPVPGGGCRRETGTATFTRR